MLRDVREAAAQLLRAYVRGAQFVYWTLRTAGLSLRPSSGNEASQVTGSL
jgi:hypothetical protein